MTTSPLLTAPTDRSSDISSSPSPPAPAGTAADARLAVRRTPTLTELAGAARHDRNRAVDLYRALAMVAVALGHWAAIAVSLDADGALVGGNALAEAPSLSWLSWLFQVMPLFFVVGGFSSAMSLDAAGLGGDRRATQGRAQDWVAARLRRMLAPTVVLAATWLVLLSAGWAAGVGHLAAAGAVAAAIPLWFLANYTIDTALAPTVLPRFRRNPALVAGAGVAAFVTLEALRFAGVPWLPQLNWVLGWLLFQVAGFAWRDGLLPTGRRMLAVAAGLWTLAAAAVTVGPYPMAMVHFPGIGDLSPTHPPSLALLLFGAAYSATALAVAPVLSRWLAGPGPVAQRAWTAVVAGNTVAMSVYLWHFTAAVAATAVLYGFGWLPTAAVGSGAWWLQKLPLMALSAVALAGIVAAVARVERRALLARRTPWPHGPGAMLVVAALISASVKGWSGGSPVAVAAGIVGLLALWHLVLVDRDRSRAPQAKVVSR